MSTLTSQLGQAILSEPDPSPEDENDIALADRRTRAAARRVENGTYESVPAEVEDDRTNGNGVSVTLPWMVMRT